ncbi:MAG: SprT family zinc-dependent metalloprotease [Pararobbsia sp.]
MPQAPSPRTAALDTRQLDLPLFDEPDLLSPSSSPSPASPRYPAAHDEPPARQPRVPPPATLPDGSRLRHLALGQRVLPYRLKRSSRRTIGFVIDGSGLTVTSPRWVTLTDIETAIADKQQWIVNKLTEWQGRAERRALPDIVWTDGAELPYLGKTIRIAIGSASGSLRFDEAAGLLELGLPAHIDAQQVKDRVQSWLQSEAKRIFAPRLDLYAQRLGVRYTSFGLSSAATRWGSCTSEGKIRLNWRLIHFPLSIIDYVVAHELAHLREMNHSARFWETVASIFPEFREARHTLKNHPPELLPAL